MSSNRIYLLVILISIKLFSQEPIRPSYTLSLKKHYQKLYYENSTIEPKLISQMSTDVDYIFNLEDYDFKKNKVVKNVSYDLNNDKRIDFYVEFNKNGNVIKVQDFIEKEELNYNYSEKNITITKLDIEKNQKIFVDSIFFNDNKKLVKQSTTFFDRNDDRPNRFVCFYEYNEDKLLKKKLFYSSNFNKMPDQIIGSVSFYEHSENKITERNYGIYKKYKESKLTSDPTLTDTVYSKKIYKLNSFKKVYKIDEYSQGHEEFIRSKIMNYDNSKRLISIKNEYNEIIDQLKFDIRGNIVEIGDNRSKDKIKYNQFNDVVNVSNPNRKGVFYYEFEYIYDKYNNWTSLKDDTYHFSRTINYY